MENFLYFGLLIMLVTMVRSYPQTAEVQMDVIENVNVDECSGRIELLTPIGKVKRYVIHIIIQMLHFFI